MWPGSSRDAFSCIWMRTDETQGKLSAKAGVNPGSLKRFEQSGEISLQSFTKLAIALEVEGEPESLFSEVPFGSIEEMLNEQAK